MSRTKPWRISDELWEQVRPVIPARPPHPKGGRPPADDRQMFEAMVYVLRTGIQWNALPRELGASSTVYDRFRLWERQGVFERLWAAGLQEFDEVAGLEWEWQSLDGTQIKAPFGGAATGSNPVDRKKRGTKRSQLSEGHGLPLAVVLVGANRTDMIVATATLDALVVARPAVDEAHAQHLCLDAGDDYPTVLEAATERGYTVHVRPNWWNRNHGQPATPEQLAQAAQRQPEQRPRRWVVERLHSWLNRNRRLIIRWDKLTCTYLAFLGLAHALLCFQQAARVQARSLPQAA
ncbi:MAG TPA: IS5 family transposase [Ktedonobacteraceae bacterium]|nr:IS5 family transposase [Ktedonobacteraceae bacterium]